jgi:hypothetical protein
MIQHGAPLRFIQYALGNPRFSRGMTALCCVQSGEPRRASYFIAPKRLSNEFGGTIGAEPET